MRIQTPTFVRALALTSVLAFVACSQTETTADHMEKHFDEVDAVKTAIIAGDVEAAREPAQWLASHEPRQRRMLYLTPKSMATTACLDWRDCHTPWFKGPSKGTGPASAQR